MQLCKLSNRWSRRPNAWLFCGALLVLGSAAVQANTLASPRSPQSAIPLSQLTRQVAEEISAQKLSYSTRSADLRDCSGIFHRTAQRLESSCPGVLVPPLSVRSSRQLAAWYAKQGHLTVVRNPLTDSAALQPGAVLFFGEPNARRGKKSAKHNNKGARIHHIGIVTEVEYDKQGRVIGYHLFHGRSPRKAASISYSHRRNPDNPHQPPFGNANQALLAIATICTDQPCRCLSDSGKPASPHAHKVSRRK